MPSRMSSRVAVAVTLLVAAGCTADRGTPTEILRVPIFDRVSAAAGDHGSGGGDLDTHLNGRNEVPSRETRAQGEAFFRISDDGQSVSYRLIVANIDNVFMAHIHLASAGVNGPIVVWLFPSTAPVPGPLGGGRLDGPIAEGTFSAADLVGPLAGHPLGELLDAIRSGGAYVNVHTNDGVDPANTGAGDFPAGEIRGQLGPTHD